MRTSERMDRHELCDFNNKRLFLPSIHNIMLLIFQRIKKALFSFKKACLFLWYGLNLTT